MIPTRFLCAESHPDIPLLSERNLATATVCAGCRRVLVRSSNTRHFDRRAQLRREASTLCPACAGNHFVLDTLPLHSFRSLVIVAATLARALAAEESAIVTAVCSACRAQSRFFCADEPLRSWNCARCGGRYSPAGVWQSRPGHRSLEGHCRSCGLIQQEQARPATFASV